MCKQFSFLFLALINISLAIGQELPPIINYSTNDYHAGNQNWMIAQAASKLIYTANNNGLLEFNGAQWNLYPTPNGSIIRSVKCHENKVYTGFYMDFGYWEKNNKGILSYTSIVKETGLKVQEDEQFWEIFIEDGYVLFQSLNSVYSYDLKSKKITSIVVDSEISKFFRINGRFILQDLSRGLLEIKSGRLQLISSDIFFKETVIINMFNVHSQAMFITSENEIYQLNGTTPTLVAPNRFKEESRVYSAKLLQNGSLMVGTISDGVVNLNLDGTVNYHIDAATGLANNTVLALFEDRDSNVWMGLDNGLSCLNAQSRYKSFTDRNGKLGTIYTALYVDDLLYLGTNQGLFVKSLEEKEFSLIKATQGQVWALRKVGNTIFCGHNDGTFVVKGRSAQLIAKMAGVWDIQPLSKNSDLVIQGSYSGLHILERLNGQWKLKNKIDGIDISAKDFAVDGLTVYLSHEYKGVYKLDLDSNYTQVKKTSLLEQLGKGITSDIITSYNDIIYANSTGIFVKKKGESEFIENKVLSAIYKDGYTSSTLIDDQEGGFWLFTENHLNMITKQPINDSYKVSSIPLARYVRNEKRGYENLTRIQGTNYLLGSALGYIVIDVNDNKSPLHTVTINRVSHLENDKEITHDLSKPVTLSYDNNNLTVYFNTSIYKGYHTIYYRYKLDKNVEWSEWSTDAYVNFKNLDHGDYTFEVQSMEDSVISQNNGSLEIVVKRPYYLSNMALILYAILAFLLVLSINKLYTLYYNKERARALDKQQRELELRNLENEKDLIKLRNEKLKIDIEIRNRELAVSAMSMIKKNETLNEIKTELEKSQNATELKSVKKLVDDNLSNKEDWVTFEKAFNNADKDFFQKIKELHPELTSGDLRLCVYLRLNLSSKEIAPLLNISHRSVEIKRYRLRKKLGLSRDDSLSGYIVEV